MSEQKKPQAGEWWFANDGSGRVYVIGQTTADVSVYELKDGLVSRDSDWSNWHHEPRCTGWDWQPEPKPEWFDLTPFGEHRLRKDIDRYERYRDDVWLPIQVYNGATVNALKNKWGHDQKFRCLLKDAPPELVAKANTETVTFYEYMVRCGVGNEDWQLKWRTSKPKTNNWIPTGRTETREVVR